MILKLYSSSKTFLATLKYKDLRIDKTIDGDRQLSASVLYDGQDILEEMYLRDEEQEYVIKETNSPEDGWIEIVANLNMEELQGTAKPEFAVDHVTAYEAIVEALTGTGWIVDATDYEDDKERSFQLTNVNVLDIITKIREAYIAETSYDTLTKTVYLKERVGEDKGAYFIEGFNAKTLKRRSDTNDYITRLIPIGEDDLTIEEVNNDVPYVENYQYTDKIIYGIWQDTNYDDPDDLMDDAIYKLNEMSKPRVSYSADVIDLAKMSDNYDILSYDIGDTVTIRSNTGKINDKQRIVKMTVYPDNPEKNTCELGSTVLSFDDLQKAIEAARETVENVTNKSGIVIGSKVYLPGGESSEPSEMERLTTRLSGMAEETAAARLIAVEANDQAVTAKQAADAATESSRTAATAANAALLQLGTIEDVAGTLAWIQEHGSYIETQDTTVQAGTIYYELIDGAYIPITSPDPEKNPSEEGWFVLDVSQSQSDYIMAHLAVTEAGLWVLPFGIDDRYVETTDTTVQEGISYYELVSGEYVEIASPDPEADPSDEGWFVIEKDPQYSSGYKTLLSDNGMVIYDENGVDVATYGGESIVLKAVAQGLEIKITGESIQFLREETPVAWMDAVGFNFSEGVVKDSLRIGNFLLHSSESGRFDVTYDEEVST